MESEIGQGGKRSADSVRLEALLDKLVAAQLDLEPICKMTPDGASGVNSDVIAQACSALRSAITDLRDIIQRIGLPPL